MAGMRGGEGLLLAAKDWQKQREWEEEIEGKGEAAAGDLELPENGRNGWEAGGGGGGGRRGCPGRP